MDESQKREINTRDLEIIMEKFSSFERVVGNISEAEKEQILRDKGERFDDQVFEDLKGQELEQTPEELQIIDLVNEATNEIRRQYGLKDFDIPPKNIHFMTEEQWLAKGNEGLALAFYDTKLQAIFMRKEPRIIPLLKTLIHEMLHFKSYNALQMTQGENRELHVYRIGLKVHARDDGEKKFFDRLNEAVTEELTMRITPQLWNDPLFAEELSRSQGVMAQYPRAETDSGAPLFDADTFYAEVDRNESSGEAIGGSVDRPEKPGTITVARFADQPERKMLNDLMDKILQKNPGKFQDREAIFQVFAAGLMTGNILPVGRLIKSTFDSASSRLKGGPY